MEDAKAPSAEPGADTREPRLERQILMGGLTLIGFLVVEVGALMWWRPALAAAVVPGLLAGLVLGREAGIPTGLALGAPPLLMLQVSAMRDLATGAVAYGGLWMLLHRSTRVGPWVQRILDERREEAYEQRGFITRWGRWGVFLFMLIPFMVNGPLVVSMAARFAGLGTRAILLPVITATFIGAAMWVLFSNTMLRLLDEIEGGLDIALTGVFLGAMLAWAGWRAFTLQRRLRQSPK